VGKWIDLPQDLDQILGAKLARTAASSDQLREADWVVVCHRASLAYDR
jgi:hypothetical protein